MNPKPGAVFLDFGTMGPGIDTAALDRQLDVHYFDATEADDIDARLRQCRIAIVNKARLDAARLRGAPALEFVALCATGTDNVDLAVAREQGIGVANIRDYCSAAVAQHVFALVLALNQRLVGYDRLARSGGWSRSRAFTLFDYPIRELAGQKLGIVGFGALGRATARIGIALGMEILVAERPGGAGPIPADRLPFAAVLEQADVLSLHCPLTDATRNLLGPAEFRRMQRHALVINTARGGLIDQQALADALRAGLIGGAGIDVLPQEPPPPGDPLLAPDIPNLLLTPHIAWASVESRQRALEQVAENVESFLAGGDLRRVV